MSDIPRYAIPEEGTLGFAFEMVLTPVFWLLMLPLRIIAWFIRRIFHIED